MFSYWEASFDEYPWHLQHPSHLCKHPSNYSFVIIWAFFVDIFSPKTWKASYLSLSCLVCVFVIVQFSLPKTWKANTGPYLSLSVYLSLYLVLCQKHRRQTRDCICLCVFFVIVIVIVILYNFLCQKHGRRTRDCFRPSGFWLMHHYCYPCDLNNDTRQMHMF